ncbi:ATP synthase F0 subunit B [Hippea maritima]|uniref:ATP synthase subunit b n=1 Tax=Hippea maritima (strain ATCC 700847 / DSM 10411 / MH2) TaxID=760142 RepID=F2LW30_HIPMA|nr:ATP synthase F0 subunit B [Hippea maritima]AEA33964.1 ATP synthase subunit b [Hippea maritima DSM 10411]
MIKKILKVFFGLVLILVLPTIVFAAEEGSSMEPHMLWRIIDFILFIAILYYFLKKPVADFFRGRKESIVGEFENAKRAKEEAEKLLRETEEKLKALEDEIRRIIETFESMAESEKQRILAELEQTIKRIRNSIEEEKASILSKAKMELLKSMSEETIANLKEKFSNLSKDEHAKINDKFIRSLQQ